jgi:hypothetical protein
VREHLGRQLLVVDGEVGDAELPAGT